MMAARRGVNSDDSNRADSRRSSARTPAAIPRATGRDTATSATAMTAMINADASAMTPLDDVRTPRMRMVLKVAPLRNQMARMAYAPHPTSHGAPPVGSTRPDSLGAQIVGAWIDQGAY